MTTIITVLPARFVTNSAGVTTDTDAAPFVADFAVATDGTITTLTR